MVSRYDVHYDRLADFAAAAKMCRFVPIFDHVCVTGTHVCVNLWHEDQVGQSIHDDLIIHPMPQQHFFLLKIATREHTR